MYYWIIKVFKGNATIIGPYSSEAAAENRMQKSKGGELHLFRSSSRDSKTALDEFRSDVARGAV